MNRANGRRANFKKTVDEAEGRRRRDETTRQIRKNKKEEQLLKRRMGAPPADVSEPAAMGAEVKPKANKVSVQDIPQLKQLLTSPTSSMEELVEATRGIRRILSVERDPPVDEVLSAGLLPNMISNLIANPQAHSLIFESAWALTNIASTTKTHVVVESGAVGPLIQLLQHENADVREQAAWCLGNIAGDNKDFRDGLLREGAIAPLLMNMSQPANMSLLNNVTWCISNLCRGKPSPDMTFLAPVIEPLCDLLRSDQVTVEVQVDAVWALSYISDGPNERIEQVMKSGITERLVHFLSDKTSQLVTPTIRCLGNFVTGSDFQTQAVLDAGILNHLGALLEHPRRTIRKETCWLASNIAAGTHVQITEMMRGQELMQKLVDTSSNASWETKKEALWTLSNICTTGNDEHIKALVQYNGLRPLAEILAQSSADPVILVACLDAVERILDLGEREKLGYAQFFDEFSGIDNLENLQEHPSNDVYKKTVQIIEAYFGAEDVEDENLAPATTDAGTFGFGISSPKQLFPVDSPAPVFQFGDVSNRAF